MWHAINKALSRSSTSRSNLKLSLSRSMANFKHTVISSQITRFVPNRLSSDPVKTCTKTQDHRPCTGLMIRIPSANSLDPDRPTHSKSSKHSNTSTCAFIPTTTTTTYTTSPNAPTSSLPTQAPKPLLNRRKLLLPRRTLRVSENQLSTQLPILGDIELFPHLSGDEVGVVLWCVEGREEGETGGVSMIR